MSNYKTNPTPLLGLLQDAEAGVIKLPEFQRSWIWDEDRIKSLVDSVSQDFPIGAVMTLQTGGEVRFHERLVEGAPDAAREKQASSLILDGQQRITSLYQTCLRGKVVETVTARRKKVKRWFYIDMRAAMREAADREQTIVGVPEDRVLRRNFGRDIVHDLSSPKREFEERMFPLCRVFDWTEWQSGFLNYWNARHQDFLKTQQEIESFNEFANSILHSFKLYTVPLIELPKSTTGPAVCSVFEKVNTGGVVLDTFELVTATYAASGFNLREDWLGAAEEPGRQRRLTDFDPLLKGVSSMAFLQVVSLLATSARATSDEKNGRDPRPISATRQSLLRLPLEHYRKYADQAQQGFEESAKFLREINIFRQKDLPYGPQLVPLAAILGRLNERAENAAVRERLACWYWNGVFGEHYGSATETRFARDVTEVPRWALGKEGAVPTTVSNTVFRADRLLTLRTRQSAAYKGMNALLMGAKGARDWLSGKRYDAQVLYDESADVHHIFPTSWCNSNRVPEGKRDSIINKTPLGSRTNRKLGGSAPSEYLARLRKGAAGSPPIPSDRLDEHLRSHQIAPDRLCADDFDGFFAARREAPLSLIEAAAGKKAFRGDATDEPEAEIPDAEDEAA